VLPLRSIKRFIVWEVVSEVRIATAYILVEELERNLWVTLDGNSIGLSIKEELG